MIRNRGREYKNEKVDIIIVCERDHTLILEPEREIDDEREIDFLSFIVPRTTGSGEEMP
jgi:hypothetical protein